MAKGKKKITAEEFDQKFESGQDMSENVDWENATKTVNVDLPKWAISELDKEASRRGVARQALMKMWLIDKLDALKKEVG
jgi:hypothetical protein